MALTKISTDGVKDDAVTAGKIPANAVGSSELADNAVDTAAIADDAVTSAKIANNTITSANIADNAITTDAIANGNITNVKLNSNSVDSNELVASSVTTAKIADDAVTADKLANSINTAIAANTAKDLTALSASNLTSGTVPDARFPATLPSISGANLTNLPVDTSALQADINTITANLALLGFQVATNGSLAKYNLIDQAVDNFENASGIDASASTNELLDTTSNYIVGGSINYPTGGTVTTYTANGLDYRLHTFTADGNFVAANNGTADMLILGGGGGGGNYLGGGGGAGEALYVQNRPITAATYGVQVGDGGAGNTVKPTVVVSNGANGGTKSVTFGEESIDNLQKQWDDENKPLEMPEWLTNSMQLKVQQEKDEQDSGFGSDIS